MAHVSNERKDSKPYRKALTVELNKKTDHKKGEYYHFWSHILYMIYM